MRIPTHVEAGRWEEAAIWLVRGQDGLALCFGDAASMAFTLTLEL